MSSVPAVPPDVARRDMLEPLDAAGVAAFLVDHDLRLEGFTPAAAALFGLRDADAGRPVSGLAMPDAAEVAADLRRVLAGAGTVERRVGSEGGSRTLRMLRCNIPGGGALIVVPADEDAGRGERERLLHEVQRRAAELDAVVESMPDIVTVTGPSGEIVRSNAAAARILGIRTGEWPADVGDRIRLVRMEHPDGTPVRPEETANQRALRGETVRGMEEIIHLPDGRRMWLSVSAAPVRVDGRITGSVVTSTDFTQMMEARAAMRESEQRYAAIFARAPFAIALVRMPDVVLVDVNDAFLKLFECTREETVGRTSVDLGIADPARRDEVGARLRRDGLLRAYECERRTRSGASRTISLHVDPVKIGGRDYLLNIVEDITERRRAVDALRASEERFSRAFDASPAALSLADPQTGRIVEVNRAFTDLYGHSREDALGRTAVELGIVSEEERGRNLQRLHEAGPDTHAEIRVRARGGRVADVLARMALIDVDGRPCQLTAMMDVSEHRRAERALAESEGRYRTLFETMTEGFALIEILYDDNKEPADFRYLEVNPAFERHTGLSAAAVVGKAYWALFPSAERVWVERYGRVGLTGEPAHFEGPFGALGRWFEVIAYRTAPGRVAVVFFDVTDRHRAAQERERWASRLATLVETSAKVVRETTVDGLLQAIAEAARELTGARVATACHAYVDGTFRVVGVSRAEGAPACPPGSSFGMEKGGVCRELLDGAETLRLTDAAMRAHPRWSGQPEGHVPLRGLLGVRLVGRDGGASGVILATDRDQGDFTAEDESLLRQLGVMGSLALQHVEARLAVEESDRRKAEFLGVLSHELRNPLTPIRNGLYVLERSEPGGERARRAMAMLDRQSLHLSRLVDDLLDVTRISRGKIRLHTARHDLCEVVAGAVDDLRAVFEEQGIALAHERCEAPLPVHADRTRVAQIVGNLLLNAAKFTPRGGRATIRVERDEPAGEARVVVRDTGEGIPGAMLERIFEPFVQLDGTLDRTKGGLGLGLALARSLAQMHGGSLAARSDGPGRGSEFVLRLPLVPREPPPEESAR